MSQNPLEKYAKTFFKKGGDIEAVLQRLDRLTTEEARMTVTQTLEVVYGLVNNVKLVMDSTPGFAVLIRGISLNCPLIDGDMSTDGIRQALGMFLPIHCSLTSY